MTIADPNGGRHDIAPGDSQCLLSAEVMIMDVLDVTPILNVSSPTFGAVISGTSEIFLCQGGQGARGGPMPREPWDNQAGSTWMSWWVHSPAEVDAIYALALRLGVVAPWPPSDMPWNVRECHIRHPDGHTFRVGARLEAE